MKVRLNQAGVGTIAAAFVIVFFSLVGFAGYKVWTLNHAPVVDTESTASVKAPAKINSQADLSKAGKALDNSSTDVNTSLNDNALNADLNDML